MTVDGDYKEILTLLRNLEDKLTGAINTGLAAVNLAIATLQDSHNRALLEQERRNAAFAERVRVEQVAVNAHDAVNQLMTLKYRVGELEKTNERTDGRFTEIQRCIDEMESSNADRGFKLLGGAAGYLVTVIIVFGAAVLTFLLTRGVH